MQSLIPFLENLMPDPQKEIYNALLNELRYPDTDNYGSAVQIIQSNLTLIRRELTILKNTSLTQSFPSEEDEIIFFKITKPHFHSLLVYWSAILELELHRPLGGHKMEEKYLHKHLRKINWFFEQHAAFYAYFRSGKKYLDAQYFTRNTVTESHSSFPHCFEIDALYSTEKDWLVAKMLANERLQSYIERSVSKLRTAPVISIQSNKKASTIHWTASKTNLVELIYALHLGGVFNNGNAEIKDIASHFEYLFHVELGNFYSSFNEIRLRKKGRTQLLDTVKEKLIRKMDELDDRK